MIPFVIDHAFTHCVYLTVHILSGQLMTRLESIKTAVNIVGKAASGLSLPNYTSNTLNSHHFYASAGLQFYSIFSLFCTILPVMDLRPDARCFSCLSFSPTVSQHQSNIKINVIVPREGHLVGCRNVHIRQ